MLLEWAGLGPQVKKLQDEIDDEGADVDTTLPTTPNPAAAAVIDDPPSAEMLECRARIPSAVCVLADLLCLLEHAQTDVERAATLRLFLDRFSTKQWKVRKGSEPWPVIAEGRRSQRTPAVKPVYAVGDDDDDNNDGGGDRLFTSTLVAAVEALCGHLTTYSDLPAYIRKWVPGSCKERRVRFSNNMLEVMCLGSVGLCVCVINCRRSGSEGKDMARRVSGCSGAVPG